MLESRTLHSVQIILQGVIVVDCEVGFHFVGLLGRHSIRVLNGCKGSRYLFHPRTRYTLILGSNNNDGAGDLSTVIKPGPDFASPLAWRSFVNEPSILQFLEERVHQEPLFEKQLFD